MLTSPVLLRFNFTYLLCISQVILTQHWDLILVLAWLRMAKNRDVCFLCLASTETAYPQLYINIERAWDMSWLIWYPRVKVQAQTLLWTHVASCRCDGSARCKWCCINTERPGRIGVERLSLCWWEGTLGWWQQSRFSSGSGVNPVCARLDHRSLQNKYSASQLEQSNCADQTSEVHGGH